MTPAALLPLVADLEADLRERAKDHEPSRTRLREEHAAAREAGRTAATLNAFVEAEATQLAVGWVLSCVFVRYLEDAELIDPVLSGGGGREITGRLHAAGDVRDAYFRGHPAHSDRDYLLGVFEGLDRQPGTGGVFGQHNAVRVRPGWASGEAIGRLVAAFRALDPDTDELRICFGEAEASRKPGWSQPGSERSSASRSEDVSSHQAPASPTVGSADNRVVTNPAFDSRNTRFLGDLYQDLSAEARSRYALLQTPHFVESFILDRTLTPALEAFGLTPEGEAFRIIDPACGSGHFLLGAFPRLLAAWEKAAPAMDAQERVLKALDSLHGVDLNPYAVAITRFRLSLAALAAAGHSRLAGAPDWNLHVACGDSLLHGSRPTTSGTQSSLDPDENLHSYSTEDEAVLQELLAHGRYHAVVGNPPYITVKDKKQNEAIRARYGSCSGKYALSVPFMERIFDLAKEPTNGTPAGFTGQITSNSFMKREFGKKLIRDFVPGWRLTHVIDTSGAYLPGHGTPTVILFGRPRRPESPRSETVRAVLGIRGEPKTPEDPAKGEVWSAIVKQVDEPGSESEWVSVVDAPRERYEAHPWSLTGGGAVALKERIEEAGGEKLGDLTTELGIAGVTGEDEVILINSEAANRIGWERRRPLLEGDLVRDWSAAESSVAYWVYDDNFKAEPLEKTPKIGRYAWPYRTNLSKRKRFGTPMIERGYSWYEWQELYGNKLRAPLTITFAEVATHNHFVLDRGGKVFKQTAPVIKLPPDATEADHLALLGLLNSSTALFWLKQNCHNKGSTVDSKGSRQTTDPFENFYQYNGTKLKQFPLPQAEPNPRTVALAEQIDRRSADSFSVEACLADEPTHEAELEAAHRARVALQEELDWHVYGLYGLLPSGSDLLSARVPRPPGGEVGDAGNASPPGGRGTQDPPPTRFGERAFEIKLARDGTATTWFSRHHSEPTTQTPDHWPAEHAALVERRIAAIEAHPRTLDLLERPEHKRRWNRVPFAKQKEEALRRALLLRLEILFDLDGRMSPDDVEDATRARPRPAGEAVAQRRVPGDSDARATPVAAPASRGRVHGENKEGPVVAGLVPVADIAEAAARDERFLALAAAYTGTSAPDLEALTQTLVEPESVPAASGLRFKPPGLRKHADWLETWALQRREDQGEDVGSIPVPPKYKSSDFKKPSYWKLRGKLDVPKERWLSFPAAGRSSQTLYAWAGLDHAQLAEALATHLGTLREAGLTPPDNLLVALKELLPWVAQWHPAVDPEFGETLAESLTALLASFE